MTAADLSQRCDAIEQCYEFLLAYAAQGLPGDQGSKSGGTLRETLQRMDAALDGLSAAYDRLVADGVLQPAERYAGFGEVLARDAASAHAAVWVVMAQASISSQLVDNLNASIHLRALLTDLFLIDEILKPTKANKEGSSL